MEQLPLPVLVVVEVLFIAFLIYRYVSNKKQQKSIHNKLDKVLSILENNKVI